MKIAFAIEHYTPRQGGAEQYAWGLAHWLVLQGHSVDVFTSGPVVGDISSTPVHLLNVPQAPRSKRPARFAAALTEALQGTPYDIVQAFNHAWPCDVLRLGGGCHVAFEKYNILSAPTPFTRRAKEISTKVTPWYQALRENERRQFEDPRRRFIAISRKVADDMAAFYPHAAGRIHLIYNALDLAAYNPSAAAALRTPSRLRLALEDDRLVLLFVSNNFRLKGLRDLIQALPAIVDRVGAVRLLVAGRGDARPFQRLAEKLGVPERVQFCGHTDDLLSLYAAADVLVHPSYYDAFGFVCLEAMGCGLPIVCSRNSGVSELMKDGEGSVLIDMPCPPDQLAEAILRAAEPSFRKAAAALQWNLAQQYPIERNYQSVLQLYRQVVEEKQYPGAGACKRAAETIKFTPPEET